MEELRMKKFDVTYFIMRLGRQLGLPLAVLKKALPEDWDLVFREAGAYHQDRRYWVHDSNNPELKNLPLIAPGAEIAAISKDYNGKWHILVQVRNNGEEREEDKEIGVPGGASDMWSYTPKGKSIMRIALEHPMLTAYREWKEEVGCVMPYEISYLTNVTTTNSYDKYPDAYASSVYYYVEVPWEYMENLKRFNGSSEGKIKVIPIGELSKYKWFPDAEVCFEMLMDKYAK